MPMKRTITTAKWGQRMIEVRIRFWTDNIAEGKGKIKIKECWDSGMVYLQTNKAHGIEPNKTIPFNSLAEIPSKIETLLQREKIKVHIGTKAGKYLKMGT